MENTGKCPECQTLWQVGKTCQDDFHQMLFWEAENPVNGEVHHLMVLCYHLQHPSLYSPEGLAEAQNILVQFLDEGVSPAEMVKRKRGKVDSGKRNWKITSRPASHGVYEHPVQWTMTAADVVAGGIDQYRENVRSWARSVLEAIKESGSSVSV